MIMIQLLVWKSFSSCFDWTSKSDSALLFNNVQEQIKDGIEFQRGRMEANKRSNQQNVPQLGNQSEAIERLQLRLEGTNVMLAPWIIEM